MTRDGGIGGVFKAVNGSHSFMYSVSLESSG